MSIFDLDRNTLLDHSYNKIDTLEVSPTTSSADSLNNSGTLLFQVQHSPNPLDICNSWLYFKIKITGCDEATTIITLEHNWFLHLFDQISIKLGSSDIENIENPGDVSSLLQFVMTDSDYKKQYGELSGWIPDVGKGDETNDGYKKRQELYMTTKTFEGMYPLKNIFGFFQLYDRIIQLIPFELRMERNENYKKIFYGTAVTAGKIPKIQFETLKLYIPSITCNDLLNTSIMKRLNSPTPVRVDYLERIYAGIDMPEGSRYSWKPTILGSRPRYILIGFKDPDVSYTKNNSKFIQAIGDNQIKELRVQLNSTYYPINYMKFNAKNNEQAAPYFSYVNVCKAFGVDPQLSLVDYKNLYSVFAVDLSAQDEFLSRNGVSVTIEIEKDTAFKAKVVCVILVENTSHIDFPGNKVTKII